MLKLSLDQLKTLQKTYTTSLGYWLPGETVVIRGKDIFKDLKDDSWFELLMFSLTGRQFTKNQISLFESIWALSTSYPDPRLWNNRVAAISATAGSSVNLSIAAGNAVSESCLLGSGPFAGTYELLVVIKNHLDCGGILADFLQDRLDQQKSNQRYSTKGCNRTVVQIPGYGRPIVNRDERVIPLFDKAKSLGFGDSDYVKTVFDIEKCLHSMNRKMTMNISVLISALCLEQRLTRAEYLSYMSMCFLAGIVAVYHDVEMKFRHGLFPMAVNQVHYCGKTKRSFELDSCAAI